MIAPASIFAFVLLAAPADKIPDLQRADSLRTSNNAGEVEQAARIYTAALEKDPNNIDLLLKASIALLEVVAQKTNGAIATLHGTQDCPEFREIWGTTAKQALDLMDRAHALAPTHPGVPGVYAAAYGYYSASFGIITAIAHGAASEFKKRAQDLIEREPDFDDALGYYLVGLLNIVAPWPVASSDDASDYLTLALSQAPTSVRNNYIMGIQRASVKRKDEARKYFHAAIDLPCHGAPSSERMFCTYLKQQSQKSLDDL